MNKLIDKEYKCYYEIFSKKSGKKIFFKITKTSYFFQKKFCVQKDIKSLHVFGLLNNRTTFKVIALYKDININIRIRILLYKDI